MRETIKRMIAEFHEKGIPKDLVPRDVNHRLFRLPHAKIIVGPRRVGKTYLLFQIMKTYLEEGKQIEDFIYINFEDNRLIDFTYHNFEDILEAYKQLYPGRKPILFLDEIHNVEKWEYFVRRLVDQKYKVFLTGSNAHLLSKEYATKLGGRYVEIPLYPPSFREFLRFKGIDLNPRYIYSDKRHHLLKHFDEYLRYGSLPETIFLDPEEKRVVLRHYLDSVIYRDIISRYRIEDSKLLELMIKKLSENLTNPFSFNSIVKKLKAIGYKTNVKTISTYYSYLTEVFLIINATQMRESVLKKEMERKAYFMDNGYLSILYIGENKGKLLENLIAQHVYKKRGRLLYYKNRHEIDFAEEPAQVTDSLTSDNLDREVEGLFRFMEKMKKRKGYIITYDQEETIKKGSRTIHILPAWRYLLQENL